MTNEMGALLWTMHYSNQGYLFRTTVFTDPYHLRVRHNGDIWQASILAESSSFSQYRYECAWIIFWMEVNQTLNARHPDMEPIIQKSQKTKCPSSCTYLPTHSMCLVKLSMLERTHRSTGITSQHSMFGTWLRHWAVHRRRPCNSSSSIPKRP